MWAEVEVTNDILKFINKSKNHIETFDEIKELVFTEERLRTNYSIPDMMMLSLQFQRIKNSAFEKVLNHQKLNFPEGFVIERLLAKYYNEDYVSVEDHIQQIKLTCNNDRKSRRENKRKISKLYNSFISTLFSQNKKGEMNEK